MPLSPPTRQPTPLRWRRRMRPSSWVRLMRSIINGHGGSLRELRQEAEKAEEAFYDAFNEVNTVPEYRTHCGMEMPIDTHIPKHVCKPESADTANKNDVNLVLYAIRPGFVQNRGGVGALSGRPEQPSASVINGKMPDYRKHIRELVHKDPKLRQA